MEEPGYFAGSILRGVPLRADRPKNRTLISFVVPSLLA